MKKDKERMDWVLNNKRFYNQWESSTTGLYLFIARNKKEIDKHIKRTKEIEKAGWQKDTWWLR